MAATDSTEAKRFGNCVCCGRALSDPCSINAGMGPTCLSKAAKSDSGRLLDDQPVLTNFPAFDEVGLVCRRLEDGRAATNLPQLHVRHSPTGFEWGYAGSGPADLAYNTLMAVAPWVADRYHQDFKDEFIARLPREGGYIPLEAIQAWLIKAIVKEPA